jgi:MFS family permease
VGRRFFYGWIVLAACTTVVCVGMGALFSLAIFLKPIVEDTGWSRSGVSMVALVNWLAMGVGSLVWGALCDRYGGRVVALAGGLLVGLGFVLASRVESLAQLALAFGVLVGFGVGAFYAPLTATATKWFGSRRGLAVGMVSAGIGVGMLTISPLVRWLITLYDWRTAMALVGDLAWLVVIPISLLIRDHPSGGLAAARGAAGVAGERQFTPGEVACAPQFWAIAITHFACCAAHSGPIFHMVTHATDQGVARMAAATVLSVSGLASVAGRLATGLLADRYGAKRTLVGGLALQALLVFLYLFAHSLGAFYGLALVFGMAYGGVMPLYALLVREYFGDAVMGTAYGGVFLISTLGMGLGSYAGGFIYDRFGNYGWLYTTSALIGALGILVALTFRPPRALREAVPAIAGGR